MVTLYRGPAGETWDPVDLIMWDAGGTPLGRVVGVDTATVSWALAGADTLEITCAATAANAPLMRDDGGVIVTARFAPGVTYMGVPTVTTVENADSPTAGIIRCTCAGGAHVLSGMVLPPDPATELAYQPAGGHYVTEGPASTVVRRAIADGARVAGIEHVHVRPVDTPRGPWRHLSAAMPTVAEVAADALVGTDLRVDMAPWLPGDVAPNGLTLTSPSWLADVVPYRPRPGMVWSAHTGDLESWRVEFRRPSATAVIIGQRLGNDNGPENYRYARFDRGRPVPEHGRRIAYAECDRDDDIGAVAAVELAKTDRAVIADIALSPAVQWQPSREDTPGTYWVGDYVDIDLPVVGRVRQVITEVKAEMTADKLTFAPIVGTPDSANTDMVGMIAGMEKRIRQLERK